jgi:hypothetical protein
MTHIEAMKQALNKAFQLGQRYWSWSDSEYSSHWKKADAAKAEFDKLVEDTLCTAIKQARAAPVQEPHKELSEHMMQATNGRVRIDPVTGNAGIGTPPAAQRQWVNLTDEEINACDPQEECWGLHEAVRRAEAKLKEKNNG